MKIRTTILLLLLTAGLFSYILLHERKQPPQNLAGYLLFDLEGDILRDGQVDPEVKADDIGGIDLKNASGDFAFRKQEDGTWEIAKAIKDRAGRKTIATLLDFVTKAKILEIIDKSELDSGKVKESALGLDDSSAVHLILRKPGGSKIVGLKIGRTAPLGNAMYVRFDDVKFREDIYLVNPDLHAFATQTADAYRDPFLIKYPVEDLRRFSIRRGEGVIELSRHPDDPGAGALWTITRPLADARADQEKVDIFLNILSLSGIQSFSPVSSGTPAPAEQSLVEITLWGKSDPDKKGATLSFYADPAPDSKFAICRDNDRRVEFKVERELAEELAQADSPDDFRDPHLGNIDPAKVVTIEVELSQGDNVQLYRVGENWVVRKTGAEQFNKADGGQVEAMINSLNEAKVRFVSDSLTPETQASFGLNQPLATLTFATGKHLSPQQLSPITTENSRILRIGLNSEGKTYANFVGEPFVYQVAPEFTSFVPSQLIRWRTLQLPGFDVQQFTSLRQVIGTNPALNLTFDARKFTWTAEREGKDVSALLNTGAADTLVQTLGNLQVAAWQTSPEASLKALATAPIVLEVGFDAYDRASPNSLKPEKFLLELAPTAAGNKAPFFFGRHSMADGVFLIKTQTVLELARQLLRDPEK